jgi:hypothetical protein
MRYSKGCGEQCCEHRPDFLFLAEAYWGIETKLQQIGFDFTYDKLFYDRLLSSRPGEISSYLTADAQYQEHSIRFIENHDELRAIAAFGRECSLAAAVILTTVPGLRLFHDGQLEGRHTHLPIQLVREPKEATDAEVIQFYNRLLAVTSATAFHDGKWRLIEVSQTGGDNESHYNLLAWLWHYGEQLKIVVINYSPNPAQGWLKLPSLPKTTRKVTLHNELTGVTHTQDTGEIDKQRLYVNFVPYHAEILAVVGAGS